MPARPDRPSTESSTPVIPDCPYIVRCRTVGLRTRGHSVAVQRLPVLQGLETLSIRMTRTAPMLRGRPTWLQTTPGSPWVSLLGLPDTPYHRWLRYLAPAPVDLDLWGTWRVRRGHRGVQRREALQATA